MVLSSDSPIPNGTTTNGTRSAEPAAPSAPSRRSFGVQRPKESTTAFPTPEPIAVCGIGLRLPGGIRNGDDFWELLVNGRDARAEIPASRFSVEGFDGSLGGDRSISSKHGYFLGDDPSRLDTSFFSMTKKEIEECDPQQRMLLEVAKECFDDAGEVNYRGQPIGCYVGAFSHDWEGMFTMDAYSSATYVMGSLDLALAGRISYEFDLRGPSLVVKTGCSASLVALHDACRALQAGDASAALVCGTSLILSPAFMMMFAQNGVLSPDASCKSFDAAADGFARAEGITAVYLKRLDDAIRDGNPIRAVIRNSGSNNDGRSQGLACPNGEAHEAMMRTVYAQARLDPAETAYVECHGTGTPVGDPIEAGAVGNVFGDHGVYIGSVKPNVGHSEGCSGITSLIKAMLVLEHRTIPPNIKFLNPNPNIPFEEKKLVVPIKPTPLPKDRAERVSVNSFGIGGSNAHAILESWAQYSKQPDPTTTFDQAQAEPRSNGESQGHGSNDANDAIAAKDNGTSSEPVLLLFSANRPASLKGQTERFEKFVAAQPQKIQDAAYTLALHRERLPHTAFAIVQDGNIVEMSAPAKPGRASQPIIMVFTGQGAQWPGMGRELILSNPSFRQDFVLMDEILQKLRVPPQWSLLDELLKDAEASQMHRAELSQPLCTALQIALIRHFKRLDITPNAVVGHSSGEIAAAYAAGYISLDYAMAVAYYRGYVTAHSAAVLPGGQMAAVGLGASDVKPLLRPGVCVACENSPSSTTISGDGTAVQETMAAVQEKFPEAMAKLLKVDMAYHSHHMALLATEYLELIKGEDGLSSCTETEKHKSDVLFVSSVTTEQITDAATLSSPSYWVGNLVSPVKFNEAMSNLLSLVTTTLTAGRTAGIVLEIGPHSALAGPLRQIAKAGGHHTGYVPSQVRGKDSAVSFVSALGQLFQECVAVNWRALFPAHDRAAAGLPTYAWDHSAGPFWYESRLAKDWRTRRFPSHYLLGARAVEAAGTAPQWRNVISLEREPWLADHKIRDNIVFPFAGYVAIAGEVVRQVTGCETGYRLRHIVARTALVLSATEPVEIVTSVRQQRLTHMEDSLWLEFSIASYSGGVWVKHCEGEAAALETVPVATTSFGAEPFVRRVGTGRLYDAFSRTGLIFGPDFRRLDSVSTCVGEGKAQARVIEPGTGRNDPSQAPPESSAEALADPSIGHAIVGPLHPASIDACLQSVLVANLQGACWMFQDLVIPTMVESLEVAHGAREMQVTATVPTAGGLSAAYVECVTDDGRVALRMRGLNAVSPEGDGGDEDTAVGRPDNHAAAGLHWLPDLDFGSPTMPTPKVDLTGPQLMEGMVFLCILESADVVETLTPGQPYLAKYREWLKLQVSQAHTQTEPQPHILGGKTVDLSPSVLISLSRADRQTLIEATHRTILDEVAAEYHGRALAVKRVMDHAAALFTGEANVLELLAHDDLYGRVYDHVQLGYERWMSLLTHSRPAMRVLEVGAGTGSSTEVLLRDLAPGCGVGGGVLPACKEYVFTDISPSFFPAARERFRDMPNMAFQVLDISKDPLAQGFEAGRYDLIIAGNVVHATPCLRETLSNLRVLLKDDGALLLDELSSTRLRMWSFVFGHFPGWWLGEADGRLWEPYVRPERWDMELRQAGFQGIEAMCADAEAPWESRVTMVSRVAPRENGQGAADEPDEQQSKKKVTVLYHSAADTGPTASVIAGLQSEGWAVTPCRLGHELPDGKQTILATVDLESRWFDEGTLMQDGFAAFQRLARHLEGKACRMLWLMAPFQMRCRNPRGAQSLGVVRTLRAELGLLVFTLELDYEREGGVAVVPLVSEVLVKKVQRARDEDSLNADREFAVEGGTVYVGRFRPFSLSKVRHNTDNVMVKDAPKGMVPSVEPAESTESTEPAPKEEESKDNDLIDLPTTTTTMHIARPGDLSSVTWITKTLPTAIPPGHLLVKIHATGLNFRDILVATGTLQAPLGTPHLVIGLEASGTVLAVGPPKSAEWAESPDGAHHLAVQPGHRVLLMSGAGALATTIVIPSNHVMCYPATIPPDLAAAIPVCVGTVVRALHEIARLRPGMSVLVHSACGGIGLAALELCRAVGKVTVFATVGTPEKVDFLIETYGLPRERIFSSRDDGFREGVLRGTGGRGVDVVLNSLAGELLHASWQCVSKCGTMLELGKKDLFGAGRLDMAPFLGNRAYAGIEFLQYCLDDPSHFQRLLDHYFALLHDGRLRLPDPITYFTAGETETALRFLQNGGHIGKVVVKIPDDLPTTLAQSPRHIRPVTLDPDATYLLVGGAKGLGGLLAVWLASQGARHVTILSRSAGETPETAGLFRELEAVGCAVSAVAGSVENMADVEAAVSVSGRPVRGVFQFAMVMNNAAFLDMTWDEWTATVGPKVRGTWNLHEALAGQPLDVFWMASSLGTMANTPGQANYLAACVFLESFCQYRHGLGLPATVLNICAMNGVGYVADHAQTRRNLEAHSIYMLGERAFLDFLELNIVYAAARADMSSHPSQADDSVLVSWTNPGQVFMGLRSTGTDLSLDDPANRTPWRRDMRASVYHNAAQTTGRAEANTSGSPWISAFVVQISTAESPAVATALVTDPVNVDRLAREVGRKIHELILKPVDSLDDIDVMLTLAQIGLDSLVAGELRRWLRGALGVSINTLEIGGSGTLLQLATVTAAKLAHRLIKREEKGADAGDEEKIEREKEETGKKEE